MSKFYIGQKIVAIKDHSQGIFKKGDEFTVLGIGCICKCGKQSINIGIKTENIFTRCCSCSSVNKNKTAIHWFDPNSFAPIELSTTTFEDVIKQLEPCLN